MRELRMGAVGVIVPDVLTVLAGHYPQNRRLKMRNAIITMMVVLLPAAGASAYPDKYFYSSGQILPGEHWNNVYIYNDDTVVDMLGGGADGIGTYDASTVNILGGYVSTLSTLDLSTANVSGGYVYILGAMGQSTATFSGLAAGMSFGVEDSATLNVTGGMVDAVGAMEQGTLNLRGGVVSDCLGARDLSTVNIFGYNLAKAPTGGTYGYGVVSGYWWDETPFTINLNGSETYSRINLIPEPATLLLLAFGAFALRRKG